MEPAVFALKAVPAGACIKKGDVEAVGSQSEAARVGITDCSVVVGKKTKGLTVGQRVRDEDLLP